jgi:hypothetical protein
MPKNQDSWDEFCLLQDSTMKIISLYVTWFIWALGLNLLVVAAIFAKGDVPIPDLVTGIGCLMVFGSALSVGAGIQQARYYRQALKRACQLNPFASDRAATELIFAKPICMYVCWAVPVTHASLLFGWILLIRKYGFHPYLLISN